MYSYSDSLWYGFDLNLDRNVVSVRWCPGTERFSWSSRRRQGKLGLCVRCGWHTLMRPPERPAEAALR